MWKKLCKPHYKAEIVTLDILDNYHQFVNTLK